MFQNFESSSGKGYQLVNLGSRWELHSDHGVYEGNLKQVVEYAVMELGFDFDELELGVSTMEEMFHNAAEFGIMKTFMFTFEKMVKNEKTVLH